ncbi:unnamed protein product, partial [Heterobilharzia americana]
MNYILSLTLKCYKSQDKIVMIRSQESLIFRSIHHGLTSVGEPLNIWKHWT